MCQRFFHPAEIHSMFKQIVRLHVMMEKIVNGKWKDIFIQLGISYQASDNDCSRFYVISS